MREAQPGQENLMTRLLRAFREGEPKLSKQDLIDEIKTLILAGHETATVTLLWTFYLLAKNPQVRDQMKSASDTFATWVIQESMRLKSPVPAVSRVAIQADEIAGFPIAPGQLVVCSPYVTHRMPTIWKDPETFRPERFENLSPHEKEAFVPFVIGPRACIGEHFAMLETQIVLSRLSKRFVVDLVDTSELGSNPLVSLRPNREVQVRIRRV